MGLEILRQKMWGFQMAARPTQQFIKGQTIVLEGAPGDRTFRIVSGEVLVCKQGKGTDLIPIAKLGIGEIFGEMYLFDGRLARTATVIAASPDVRLEIYYQEEMQSLLKNINPTLASILQGFSQRLRMTSTTCSELLYEKGMAKLPDGTVRQGGSFIRRKI